jgi:capsular exopolysaccharide synthesis family protein
MSKYFDEIARFRTVDTPALDELRKFPTLIEKPDTANVAARSAVAPARAEKLPEESRLEWCRTIHGVSSVLLQNRFPNSDSLGAAAESYRALRARLLRFKTSQELRSVQLTSATASEGKTMTAFNLAVFCAQLHEMSVLLLDADLRSQGLTRILKGPTSPGLAEVLSGQTEPEKAILATDVTNLYVLPAGKSIVAPPELFAGHRWQDFMTWCNEKFKLIIVDSPPVLGLSDSELISASCDSILMVVRARRAERDLLKKAVLQLDAKKLLGLVYNGDEHGKKHSYYYGAPESALKLG